MNVLVAAADPNAPAVGLGVRYWFFICGPTEELKRFLEVVTFLEQICADRIKRLGDEIAAEVVGDGSTWDLAQEQFVEATEVVDPIYGAIRSGPPPESA